MSDSGPVINGASVMFLLTGSLHSSPPGSSKRRVSSAHDDQITNENLPFPACVLSICTLSGLKNNAVVASCYRVTKTTRSAIRYGKETVAAIFHAQEHTDFAARGHICPAGSAGAWPSRADDTLGRWGLARNTRRADRSVSATISQDDRVGLAARFAGGAGELGEVGTHEGAERLKSIMGCAASRRFTSGMYVAAIVTGRDV